MGSQKHIVRAFIYIFSLTFALFVDGQERNVLNGNNLTMHCIKEVKDQLKDLPDRDSVTNKNYAIKCNRACLLNQRKLIKDGKANTDLIMEVLQRNPKIQFNDELKSKLIECLNRANEENDRCEVGNMAFECIKQIAMKKPEYIILVIPKTEENMKALGINNSQTSRIAKP